MRSRVAINAYTLWQNWRVTRTVLRFGSKLWRFNSDARVFGRLEQAFVSSLGADVLHAPHLHQKMVPFNNQDLWLRCTTPFPSTNFFTWCSLGDSNSFLCLCVEAPLSSSASSTPPWPNGSLSSLHLSGNADGARMVGASTHRSSCRASIAEHVVGSCFHCWRCYQLCRTLHIDRFHVCPICFRSRARPRC